MYSFYPRLLPLQHGVLLFRVSVLSLALLLSVSYPTAAIFVQSYIVVHFICFVFIVGQIMQLVWKQKLLRTHCVAITV